MKSRWKTKAPCADEGVIHGGGRTKTSGQETVERMSLQGDAGEKRRSRGSDAENYRENSFLKRDRMAKKPGPALSLHSSHFAEILCSVLF